MRLPMYCLTGLMILLSLTGCGMGGTTSDGTSPPPRQGVQKRRITLSLSNSAAPHRGFQITLRIPDSAYVPVTSVDSTAPVDPSSYSFPPGVQTALSNPAGEFTAISYDSFNRTLTIILWFTEPFYNGDIITFSFDLPSESTLPASLEYNGLVISIDQNSTDTNAAVSARDAITTTPIQLTHNPVLPTPGGH